MELVGILRSLWERRLLVGLGVLVALAVGMLASRQASPASVSWDASSRLLVDTPDSQLVRPNPKASETVAIRASLLADLAAREDVAAAIAREAGVRSDQLAVMGPATEALTPVPTPLVTQAAAVSSAAAPYVVVVTADSELPIISVRANAPDAEHARSLVEAVASGLRSLIAARDGGDGFSVELLTPPQAEPLVAASRAPLFAAAGALATLGVWCIAVMLLSGRSERRGAVSRTQPGVDPAVRRAA
jgi:hypothetical protein